jgi:hypothetical protein
VRVQVVSSGRRSASLTLLQRVGCGAEAGSAAAAVLYLGGHVQFRFVSSSLRHKFVDVPCKCLLTIDGGSGESKFSFAHCILMLVRGAGWFVAESRNWTQKPQLGKSWPTSKPWSQTQRGKGSEGS